MKQPSADFAHLAARQAIEVARGESAPTRLKFVESYGTLPEARQYVAEEFDLPFAVPAVTVLPALTPKTTPKQPYLRTVSVFYPEEMTMGYEYQRPQSLVGVDEVGNARRCVQPLADNGDTTIDQAGSVQPWYHRMPWYGWASAGIFGFMLFHKLRTSAMRRNPEGGEVRLTDMQAAQEAAALAVEAGLPTILWGPPGIGKTAWVEALGKALGAKVITVIGSTRDPTDIAGTLTPSGNLIPPSWARKTQERSQEGKKTLLFLDEFSSMSPLVHAALLRVVRDKIAGDALLDPTGTPCRPKKSDRGCVYVIMAANRPEEGAGSLELPPPAANRIVHIFWPRPDVAEWVQGITLGWDTLIINIPKLPDGWKQTKTARQAYTTIASYVQKTQALLDMPQNEAEAGYAWPSPRSWELAADGYAAAMVLGAPKKVQKLIIAGAVGEGQALQFMNFAVLEGLPDPEKVLAAPTKWDVPEEPDRLYLAISSVVFAMLQDPTQKRFTSAWKAYAHAINATGSQVAVATPAMYPAVKLFKEYPMAPVMKDVGKENMKPFLEMMKKAGLVPA
jgi:hypothetical protein